MCKKKASFWGPFHVVVVSPLPLKEGGPRTAADGTQLRTHTHTRTVCSLRRQQQTPEKKGLAPAALLIGAPEAAPAAAATLAPAHVCRRRFGEKTGASPPLLLFGKERRRAEDPFTGLPVPVAGSPVHSGRATKMNAALPRPRTTRGSGLKTRRPPSLLCPESQKRTGTAEPPLSPLRFGTPENGAQHGSDHCRFPLHPSTHTHNPNCVSSPVGQEL
ncbi:hypothetical protein MTO96_022293 [Rhipicephalus appendiculatus]